MHPCRAHSHLKEHKKHYRRSGQLKQTVCFIAQSPYRVRQDNKANSSYSKLGKETAARIYGELSFYAFSHYCPVLLRKNLIKRKVTTALLKRIKTLKIVLWINCLLIVIVSLLICVSFLLTRKVFC